MSRNRIIKPEICKSKTLKRVSLEANYFFIILWTHCDDFGTILNSNRFLIGECFPIRPEINEDHIEKWKQELIRERLLVPIEYNENELLSVRCWEEHQTIQNRSKRNNLNNELSITEVISTIQSLIRQKLESSADLISEKLDTNFSLKSNIERGKRKEKEKEKEERSESVPGDPDPPISFVDFYKTNSRTIITEKNIVYPDWISDNGILKELLAEHIFVIRLKKKAVNTGTGIKELFNDLEKLSGKKPDIAMSLVKNAIVGGWKSYYAIKDTKEADSDPDEVCESWEQMISLFQRKLIGVHIGKLIEYLKCQDQKGYYEGYGFTKIYKMGLKLSEDFKAK